MSGEMTPFSVVSAQRREAWAVYVILIGGYIAYCITTIVLAYKSTATPPTSTSLEQYNFIMPDMFLCPEEQTNYAVVWDNATHTTLEDRRHLLASELQNFHCTFHRDSFKSVDDDVDYCREDHEGRCTCTVWKSANPFQSPDSGSSTPYCFQIDMESLIAQRRGAYVRVELNWWWRVIDPTQPFFYRQFQLSLFNKESLAKQRQDPESDQANGFSFVEVNKVQQVNLHKVVHQTYQRNWKYNSGATYGLSRKDSLEYSVTVSGSALESTTDALGDRDQDDLNFLVLYVFIPTQLVTLVKEISPVDWGLLLSQFGGFFTIVSIFFGCLYVPREKRWRQRNYFTVHPWNKQPQECDEDNEEYKIKEPSSKERDPNGSVKEQLDVADTIVP
ncbi:hypothetical protein CYMTET_6050 [Cymbomonas tetramitiformis]|uniref:Uncharacterized protein n=1 Tax=Cymbomonas tetramitiformis TaxID=36881 RepID=A0AAE0GXX2_9CHLO|nr:hypothetical protein CYMTET_6050 [Cymbomonas tetramitiformis]